MHRFLRKPTILAATTLVMGVLVGGVVTGLVVASRADRSWQEARARDIADGIGCGLSHGLGVPHCYPVALTEVRTYVWRAQYGDPPRCVLITPLENPRPVSCRPAGRSTAFSSSSVVTAAPILFQRCYGCISGGVS